MIDVKLIEKILEKNNKSAGLLFKGSNVRFELIKNDKIKITKYSYPYNFLGYIELIPLLRGSNWGFTFYKKEIANYDDRVSLDNYHIQAISKICEKLNDIEASK